MSTTVLISTNCTAMLLRNKGFLLLFIFYLIASNNCFSQEILFRENFDDDNFESRGWYDGSKGTISTAEHIPGSASCFECKFMQGQRGCTAGTPSRHLFEETEELYVSYWVKYSENWEGSNRPYHPHEFNILTNADEIYTGPAITHLTLYIEQNEGRPLLALQDSKNVDQNCILQNNDKFIGCNGDFYSYQFTENRSVAACNGVIGGYDRRDCFFYGSGYYYSARVWDMDTVYFTDEPGSHYKNNWHFVEAYFEMNSIVEGKGIPDGKIRYWYDGQLLISYDDILMRTAQFPDLKFNQFLVAPYIGDGSPLEQTMWIDELTVARARQIPDIIEDSNIPQKEIVFKTVYPNPLNTETTIKFSLKERGYITLKVYDAFGIEAATVVDGVMEAGEHSILYYGNDTRELASGVYFLRLSTRAFISQQKITIIR